MDGNIDCMELTRAYKFRIYPDATRQGENVRPQQEATLDELGTDKTHPLRDAAIA